jgi:hypothetical protein
MITNLKLKFLYGCYNGKIHMTINGQPVDSELVDIDINLPTTVKIELSGKNYSVDTLVDSSGKILDDKFVQLKEMRLGGIPIEEINLIKICKYNTDQGKNIQSTYWGFNGLVEIIIDQENFIKYLLLLNNKFDLTV